MRGRPRTSIEEIGNRRFAQEIEMGRLPEEFRLIGRDAVDQADDFLVEPALLEQIGAVFIEAGEPQGPDTFAQTTFDHRALGGRKQDADLAFDQLGDRAELAIGETLRSRLHLRLHAAAAVEGLASSSEPPIR